MFRQPISRAIKPLMIFPQPEGAFRISGEDRFSTVQISHIVPTCQNLIDSSWLCFQV